MAKDVFGERLKHFRRKILKGMDLEEMMASCAAEGVTIENKIADIMRKENKGEVQNQSL